jgi:hypothetical protein
MQVMLEMTDVLYTPPNPTSCLAKALHIAHFALFAAVFY